MNKKKVSTLQFLQVLTFFAGNVRRTFSLTDIQLRRNIQFIGHVFSVLFALSDAFGEQVFYLSVYRAEIILCPCCDCIIQLGRESKRHLFLFVISHELVQGAGIDNRLRIMISAENNQEIGYHCRFSFFVQFYDVVFV